MSQQNKRSEKRKRHGKNSNNGRGMDFTGENSVGSVYLAKSAQTIEMYIIAKVINEVLRYLIFI
jgi:hypothetical protein